MALGDLGMAAVAHVEAKDICPCLVQGPDHLVAA